MPGIFIGYSHQDRPSAATLADAFTKRGWTVWWDREIRIGQAYDRAIESELETAKSVVVLWSKHSVESDWVRNEASAGAERGVLQPATLESVHLPVEFRHRQTADLTGWSGDLSHPGFQSLCAGITSVIGGKTDPLPAQPTPNITCGVGCPCPCFSSPSFSRQAPQKPSISHYSHADRLTILNFSHKSLKKIFSILSNNLSPKNLQSRTWLKQTEHENRKFSPRRMQCQLKHKSTPIAPTHKTPAALSAPKERRSLP